MPFGSLDPLASKLPSALLDKGNAMVFDLYEPKPATDEYLGAVMRYAAACRHKITDGEWVMVWRHRDRISAWQRSKIRWPR
jgi:hypothetical protein